MSEYYEGIYNDHYFTFNERRTGNYNESSSGPKWKQEYTVQFDDSVTPDDAKGAAIQAIRYKSLTTRDGMNVSTFDVEHDNEDDLDKIWKVTLEWSDNAQKSSGSSLPSYPRQEYTENESFTTEGGTAHITDCICTNSGQSVQLGETIYDVDANDPGPDTFNGQIGFNGESCDGVDVIRPSFSFTLQKKVYAGNSSGQMDGTVGDTGLTYRQILCWLTGSVNSSAFKGWSSGNCLFEGVSATTGVEYDDSQTVVIGGQTVVPYIKYYTLTFKFKCSMGNTSLPIAGITVQKEGWQYVWTFNRKIEDVNSSVVLETPVSVVVNDVYPKQDFSLLGL